MNKINNIVSPVIALSCLAATSYLIIKNKKTMLDVIIEEIDAMK